MTERQFQTLRWAVLFACLFSILYAIVGCTANPAAPTDLTPNEAYTCAVVQCYGEHHKLDGEIMCIFTDKPYYPEPDVLAAAWAWPGTRTIYFYKPYVNSSGATRQYLNAIASHEVCHLKGHWDEQVTEFCAEMARRDSECGKL